MEGVENIAPLMDSTPSQVPNTTSASSSNNKNVPSAETATEQSTASQKKNTEGSSSTTNNVSSTSPPQLKWVTIESQRKKYQVAIASASLPGEKLEEKSNMLLIYSKNYLNWFLLLICLSTEQPTLVPPSYLLYQLKPHVNWLYLKTILPNLNLFLKSETEKQPLTPYFL